METNTKVIKTKKLIQNAFITLCTQKGFDQLTIKDITQTAQISRGTFYLHYIDKFDLRNQYENEILTGVTTIFQTYQKPAPIDEQNHDKANSFYQMFVYLADNRQLTAALLLDPQAHFLNRMKELIALSLPIDTSKGQAPPSALAIPNEYAREILLQNVLSILTFWLSKAKPEKPAIIYDIFLKSRQLAPINLIKLIEQA